MNCCRGDYSPQKTYKIFYLNVKYCGSICTEKCEAWNLALH